MYRKNLKIFPGTTCSPDCDETDDPFVDDLSAVRGERILVLPGMQSSMTDGYKDLTCVKPFKILFYLPLLEDILSVEILYILATFMSLDCIGKYDLN